MSDAQVWTLVDALAAAARDARAGDVLCVHGPLRERLSAYLADAVEHKREWVPVSLQTMREIIAALERKT